MNLDSSLWRQLGASEGQGQELADYARNVFDYSRLPARFPWPDEPFVAAWQESIDQANDAGLLPTLRQRLVQLRFPIRAGISEEPGYRQVTRRTGQGGEADLPFERPAALQLFLQSTPAGRVPVLVAEARRDFEVLVQALTHRNEPRPVPASMGACIVSGYNDWGRIEREVERSPGRDREARFRAVLADKTLYQDRFILLSSGSYSATRAADLSLGEEEWRRRSLLIRLEHECTHYFTRQVLGSMRNVATDELIADYMGIVSSEGRYRAPWLLRFMGLENQREYRPGGRLENYRGTLSDPAFALLGRAVVRAAHQLEACDEIRRRRGSSRAATIIALTRLGVVGMASDQAATLFEAALETDDLPMSRSGPGSDGAREFRATALGPPRL